MKKLIMLAATFLFAFASHGPMMGQDAKAKKWSPKDAKKKEAAPAAKVKKADKPESKAALDPNKVKLNKERKVIKRMGKGPVA